MHRSQRPPLRIGQLSVCSLHQIRRRVPVPQHGANKSRKCPHSDQTPVCVQCPPYLSVSSVNCDRDCHTTDHIHSFHLPLETLAASHLVANVIHTVVRPVLTVLSTTSRPARGRVEGAAPDVTVREVKHRGEARHGLRVGPRYHIF